MAARDRARDMNRVFKAPKSHVNIVQPTTEKDIIHHERSTEHLPPHRVDGLSGGSSRAGIETEVSRSVESADLYEARGSARLPGGKSWRDLASAYGETSTSSDPQAAVRGAFNAASTMRNEKIKSGQFVKEGAEKITRANANEPKQPTVKIRS